MDKRLMQFFEQYMNSLKAAAPAYGELYFDHLYSEYLVIRPKMVAEASVKLMDTLHNRRTSSEEPLTWNDIYAFDLELVKNLPIDSLMRKAFDMRSKFRNIAGDQEYNLYLASKPPELTPLKTGPEPAA